MMAVPMTDNGLVTVVYIFSRLMHLSHVLKCELVRNVFIHILV